MALSLPNLSTAPHFSLPTSAASQQFGHLSLPGVAWLASEHLGLHCHSCSTQPDALFYFWPLTLVPVNEDTHSPRTPAVPALLLNQFSPEKKPEQTLQLARKHLQPSNISYHPGKEGGTLLRLGKVQECLEMLSKSRA